MRTLFIVQALLVVALCHTSLVGAEPATTSKKVTVWEIDNLKLIGGHKVTVVGEPRVIDVGGGKAIEFDGKDDGLFVAANPLAGLEQFTAEVVFRPAAGGPKEQRFLHFQPDSVEDRGLFETRLTTDGQWFLDTYLQTSGGKLTLYADKFLHPLDAWYAAAMVVDGTTMKHYVNGQQELSADLKLVPLAAGQTSIGVRFNQVHWFAGAIRQIRISPAVLKPAELLKP
ncbi:LamG domain-containing protein [Anatilimnocola sp. NA78]|uniref:LamG domain-containing protein n=1 Tax=Anatilimnocola sp. NA78 TaxID=3415683 RepID=UPI003CE54F0A